MWPFRTKHSLPAFERKFASIMVGMGSAKWTAHNFRKLAHEGFETNPVVFSCVTKLARALSSVDLHLYRFDRWGDLQKIDRHGILELINRPNAMWSGRQFLEKLATQYLIGGNAFLLGNNGPDRQPSELWLLPPDYMTVDAPGGSMLPRGYIYRPGTQQVTYPVNAVTGQSAVCHLRTVNPLDEWYGLPPLGRRRARRGRLQRRPGVEQMALLQNEGRPSGALVMQARVRTAMPLRSWGTSNIARLKVADGRAITPARQNAGRPLLLDSADSTGSPDVPELARTWTTARRC